MADKLVVVENSRGYSIQWYLAEDDDMGAVLGEGETRASLREAQERFDRGEYYNDEVRDNEHIVAILAAWKQEDVRFASDGFYWPTKTGATQAARAARIAIKALKYEKPWPEWAKQAAAHGWKPPRGWKP